MPKLVLRLKPQQCMIKQGPFKLRETQEFALQMITGVSSTLKKKKSPRHFFFFSKLTTMDVRHLKAKYI